MDGNDLEAVYCAAQEAIQYVRAGNGPFLLDCETYRIEGHYYGDAMVYRSKEELEEWRKKDPLIRTELQLIERGILTAEECKEIYRLALKEIEEAVAFAESSPEPGLETIFEDIYTGEIA